MANTKPATDTKPGPAPLSALNLAHPNQDYEDCCARCGRRDANFGLVVETTQGFFSVGKTCAKILKAAGYNVEAA